MTPGFAGMTVALIPYQNAGMTAEHGTEKILTGAAKTANKPVGELEGIEDAAQDARPDPRGRAGSLARGDAGPVSKSCRR